MTGSALSVNEIRLRNKISALSDVCVVHRLDWPSPIFSTLITFKSYRKETVGKE